jgi:polyisoprenoid-binding protein YceI
MHTPDAKRALGWLSLLVIFPLLLAACAPLATPTASAPQPTAQAQASAVPSATTAAQPTATTAVQPTSTTAPAATTVSQPGTNPAPAAAGSLTTYKIVTGQSKVTYEVGETFLNQNNRFNLAKGVTTQVTGEVYGDKSDPTKASIGKIEIDISQFASDSGQRDRYIRGNGLESSKYPKAIFVPTKIESLPASYTDGKSVSFKVTGDMTIKTTTKPVTWEVTTQLNGDTLTGTATTEILMSTFNVGPISILGMLNTEDKVKLTFEFVAKP